MGNLQKGERQCNADAVTCCSTKHADPVPFIDLSYDIVCHYWVHFWKRHDLLPPEWQLDRDPETLRFLIPKFHLFMHVLLAHMRYSFNYVPNVGRTHAETIEQNWSQSNRAASQTKVMGPGARQDTLEDIFNFHNWIVSQSFGRVFAVRLVEAIKNGREQRGDFEAFHRAMISHVGEELVSNWLAEIDAWEADFDAPCPYEPRAIEFETLLDVQLAIAKEEHAALYALGSSVQESSMSYALTLIMDIEQMQRTLGTEIQARARGTTFQELNIEKQRTAITHALQKLRAAQKILLPSIEEFFDPATNDAQHYNMSDLSIKPEDRRVFAPSDLPLAALQVPRGCPRAFLDAEERLREAECRDSLRSLQHALRLRSAAHFFTVKNVTGHNPNTRAEAMLKKITVDIYLHKIRYRYGRAALLRLRGHGTWEEELQVLNEGDVRALNERMLTAEEQSEQERVHQAGHFLDIDLTFARNSVSQPGEGTRLLSWIWRMRPTGANENSDVQDALKIEYCKARARALRWEEEVSLLLAETERVPAFARAKAEKWRSRAVVAGCEDPILAEGYAAYAYEQASREEQYAETVTCKWAPLRPLAEDLIARRPVTTVIDFELDEDESLVLGETNLFASGGEDGREDNDESDDDEDNEQMDSLDTASAPTVEHNAAVDS
ncbi:hypothetical protein CYLTODRAFT_495472 [Cylindrobasidium torrendii FP15055 ss-10]|uniref:Uncharacterized protein n=1 Tax=Cylindrobasidium torrendii FP15055 ss-10 TaxID=1314674 RepID=A0A0D7ASB1_9AGAR|nr:hypothetical protein CYLTODRAFT_495472 [Cylindrobasidium torrendii FP15055 ss-10]